MATSFLTQWFSGPIIKAICWTLIHSLWIGMIIALIAAVVISVTRKSAADLRYRLLCSALVFFVLAIGVTFYIEARSINVVVQLAQNRPHIAIPANTDNINYAGKLPETSSINKAVSFLDMHADIIFLVWLLFFVMKSLKMVGGLLYIQRIRNYKIHKVGEEFKHKIELFGQQIGIRQTIRLVQSELVKVPVAVGWLKPVILLPIGIILQLSPEQLDGILWHELAHIRRRDYLVNILQGLVETVFFFNPGLMWLSSLIRAEREACCDDMVLSRVGRKANYLEALLSFGYNDYKQAGLAMSLGSGNQLRDRLKRMISQENKRLNVAEKTVLAFGLILLTAFTTLPKASQAVKHFTLKYTTSSGKLVKSTIAIKAANLKLADKESIRKEREQQAEAKKRQLTADTIISRDTAINFISVLFKNTDADPKNSEMKAKDDKGNYYHFTVANSKLVAVDINDVQVSPEKLDSYSFMIRNIDRNIAEKRRVQMADIAAYKARAAEVKARNEDMVAAKTRMVALRAKSEDMVGAKAKLAAGWRKDSTLIKGGKTLNSDMVDVKAKYAAMVKRRQDDSVGYKVELQRVKNVINNLVKDNVVPDAPSVKWFGLSNTEFIVNGQKQTDEMQQRYKAKYGVSEGNGLYYGPVQMTGRGVFIDAITTTTSRMSLPARPQKPMLPQSPDSKPTGRTISADSIMLAREKLIKDQQRFAAEQGDIRAKLIKKQQLFAAKEGEKRRILIEQQRIFAADQNEKRQRIIAQQQLLVADQAHQQQKHREWLTQHPTGKFSMDIQPAITGVIADLVNANVITDKSDLVKFNLTNSALMVNGKKQPEELHEKLKTKYLQITDADKFAIAADPNFGLHFNAQTGGRGLGITEGPDSP